MVGRPVTLKGHIHICPMVDPGPRPHVGGPVVQVSQNFVCVEGVPIATVGDRCVCTGVPTTAGISRGSSVAKINGKKIARVGDACEHGGTLIQGESWLTFE
jgi:uncharacterized Zn-binding protein involved in type VI secretion